MNAPSRIDYLAAAHQRDEDRAHDEAAREARDESIAQDVLGELWDDVVAAERITADFHGWGAPVEWLYEYDDGHLVARMTAAALCGCDVRAMAQEAWDRAAMALLDHINKTPAGRAELLRQMRAARPDAFDGDDGAVVFG